MASAEKQLTIQYRAYAHTRRGQLINYVQDLPGDHKEACRQVIDAWYLPFALDTGDESDRDLALQCAGALEAQARVIRERFGFSLPQPLGVGQVSGVNSEISETNDMGDKGDEVEAEQPLRNPYKEEAASML